MTQEILHLLAYWYPHTFFFLPIQHASVSCVVSTPFLSADHSHPTKHCGFVRNISCANQVLLCENICVFIFVVLLGVFFTVSHIRGNQVLFFFLCCKIAKSITSIFSEGRKTMCGETVYVDLFWCRVKLWLIYDIPFKVENSEGKKRRNVFQRTVRTVCSRGITWSGHHCQIMSSPPHVSGQPVRAQKRFTLCETVLFWADEQKSRRRGNQLWLMHRRHLKGQRLKYKKQGKEETYWQWLGIIVIPNDYFSLLCFHYFFIRNNQ